MKEFCWLRHVHGKVLVDYTFDGSLNMSWSAFHADRESEKDMLPALTACFHFLRNNRTNTAMTRHSMNTIKASVEMLTPVVAFDQPLYEIAKHILGN